MISLWLVKIGHLTGAPNAVGPAELSPAVTASS